jgi:Protein of unknown function (DUF3179)
MPTDKPSPFGRGAAAWGALAALVLLALAFVLVPAWVIQPFRPQTRGGLELSYFMRRWSPLVTLAASAAALLPAARLWRGRRRWLRRPALVLAFVPLLASAWFARQNHFEWFFKPLPAASFAGAAAADFVADTDMVMAVEVNGEAAAYPVRLMAYHHIVQDVVGETPVAVTY